MPKNIFCNLNEHQLLICIKDLEIRDKKLPKSISTVFIEEDNKYEHINRLYQVFYILFKYIPYVHEKLVFHEFIEKSLNKEELCKLVEMLNTRITRDEKRMSCKEISYNLRPELSEFNCLELPLSEIKYIIGPCTFYEFKLGNRNIYLFGEQHNFRRLDSDRITSSNALIFSSFVHSLVKQNPEQTYDLMFEYILFLEKDQDVPPVYSESNAMNYITDQFMDCIHFSKRDNCKYNNLRVHYIDYRRKTKDDAHVVMYHEVEELKNKIVSLFNTPKMLKQISEIKNKLIRDKFILFINNKITEKYNKSIKFAETIQKYNLPPEVNVLDFYALVMDMYGLARLLRDFDTIEKPYKSAFKGTSDNVIYYAGNEHIKNMVEFFTKFLRLTPQYKVELKDDHCKSYLKIDMTRTSFL
jgi:hypothetical protein